MTAELRQPPTRADEAGPRPRGAHAAIASRARPVRPVLADATAAMIVAVVLPLALLQVPDAIAWAIPPQFGTPGAVDGLLRASGLALAAMAVAAPLGGLAVRGFRAGPVLIAGLGLFGVADVLGNMAHTVAQVGIDRAMHGAGAGVALAAAIALAVDRPARARRVLAGWWAACTVTALAGAPELMRHRLSGGDWHGALRPYPWLTGVALGLAAMYAVLAEGPLTAGTRNAFPAAERAPLALLTAPVAGICVIAVAVTYGRADAVLAASITELVTLAGLTVMTARASSAGWFAVAGAVTGFTLAPSAGMATDQLAVVPHSAAPLAAALGGAVLCGAAVAALLPARHDRRVVACGFSLAAAGFLVSAVTGLTLFEAACIPVVVGITVTLTTAMRRVGAAGAICGVVLMLAGALAGFVADGAVELRAVSAAARTGAPMRTALLTADGHWSLAAAAVTAAAALAAIIQRTPT